MTKRITKSNIFPFIPRSPVKTGATISTTGGDRAQTQLLRRAEEKAREGFRTSGAKRTKVAREALQIHPDCVDAYVLLAYENGDGRKRIELCRKAIEAGVRVLGKDWKRRFKGIGWLAFETRPVMRAMLELAHSLRWEDELDEALSLYRELLELNPQDNQGVRYLLVPCLYESGQDGELSRWLDDLKDDMAASLKYIRALHLFRSSGRGDAADRALVEAFESNPHVPIYLSDVVEMPDEAPDSIQFGEESEAIDFVMDNSYLWGDLDGATKWMADTLESRLRLHFKDDREMVEEALKELRQE